MVPVAKDQFINAFRIGVFGLALFNGAGMIPSALRGQRRVFQESTSEDELQKK